MSPSNAMLQDVLHLPRKERAALALRLVESLDDEAPDDVEAAWATEVRHRVDALRRGDVKTRPAAEVFRDARRRLTTR